MVGRLEEGRWLVMGSIVNAHLLGLLVVIVVGSVGWYLGEMSWRGLEAGMLLVMRGVQSLMAWRMSL